MNINNNMDGLLQSFLDITKRIEQKLIDHEEPEYWIELLDQRQVIIDQLSSLMQQGVIFTETQISEYLKPAYDIDATILPMMQQQKEKLEGDIQSFRKSKTVTEQYSAYSSYSPYGAFFDKRK